MAILAEDFKDRIRRFLKLNPPPLEVPPSTVKNLADPGKEMEFIKKTLTSGVFYDKHQLTQMMTELLTVSIWRRNVYRECEMATGHPLIAGCCDLYVDFSVGYNALQGASTWITSDDPKKENVLNKFLQDICIEERIRDWCSQIVIYGDFFVEPIGKEGLGIAYIDDNIHAADMERIDVNGRLEGFIRTGLYGDAVYSSARPVEAPWKYVHFKMYGSSRRIVNSAMGIFGDPTRRYSLEQRILDVQRKFRVTTKYGTSLLIPALHVYKRLKLAEDSLLMARITRGVLWYLYKLKVKGGNVNFDAALALVNEYAELLKRRAGLNTTPGQESFKDKWTGMFAQIEDLFVPETDNLELTVEKLGGEPNIRWIADIDQLENQLLGSMRVSKTMLGITDDLPGGIGENSSNRISINFSKNAQRVQNAVRQGIKRLCQIHLAYLKMNADPTSFDVHLAEISSAEEEELKNAMASGIDTVDKFSDFIIKMVGAQNIDSIEFLDYLNQKFLKLDDLDLETLVVRGAGQNIKLPDSEEGGDQAPGFSQQQGETQGNSQFREGGQPQEGQPAQERKITGINEKALRAACYRSVMEKKGKKRFVIESPDHISYLPNSQFFALTESKGKNVCSERKKTWESFNVKFTKDAIII
jgi:hypothetical protein